VEKNRTKKGEASRQRLLEAAAQQFAEMGYHVTKISDIVKAAGLTQAAFYLYFPRKEAIFEELVTEYRMHLKQLANAGSLVTPLPSSEAANQAKQNLIKLFMFLAASPQLSKIALFESADREVIKEEIVAMVAANLRNNQKAGHVRHDLPVQIAAECMVAMIDRMVVKLIEEKTDPITLAEDISDVLLYGILAQSKGG
jgi:TetR/AcrR family transcriptional regulator, fatty acid metabolism regulator protein